MIYVSLDPNPSLAQTWGLMWEDGWEYGPYGADYDTEDDAAAALVGLWRLATVDPAIEADMRWDDHPMLALTGPNNHPMIDAARRAR